MIRGWEELSYKERLKELSTHSLAEEQLGMDMITVYKYSGNINTKEREEFLPMNKGVLLEVTEERNNVG